MKLFKLFVTYLVLGFFWTAAPAQSQSDLDRPNFVLVYGEGAGWVSTSVQMDGTDPNSRSEFIETPNLERLAARGLTFSRGYAPSPRCTPSRAGLVTGKSPGKLHMTYISASGTGGRDEELEGGLRVPFIVAGPGGRSGEWSPLPVTALDVFPTIAELSGNADKITIDIEGGSLAGVLQSADAKIERSREEIVFHFPHYDLRNAGPATAMLLGDYKLVRNYVGDETLLYDLSSDPGERNDRSAELPDVVEELDARLTAYLLEIDAQMPQPNSGYH